MIKCKNCGMDIQFEPGTQRFICPYCSTELTEENLTEAQKEGEIKADENKVADDDSMEAYVYTCPQCGGELLTTEETMATFCSYCGSSVLLEQSRRKEQKPKYIIPFQVTQQQAAELYKKKLRRSIFAPSYMKHMDIEKVRGIYMPYWTYNIHEYGFADTEYTESEAVPGGTLIKKYSLTAAVDLKGDGIEYDASSSFPDDLSQAAGPFDFKQAKEYTPSYMSGFYADHGDVEEKEYEADAEADLIEVGRPEAASMMGLRKRGIPNSQLKFNVCRDTLAERAMYPVWFISARNRAEKKVSYAVVNGQSGKVAADLPVDPLKLIIGTLIFAVPIFFLLYSVLVPTPAMTDAIVLAFAVMGLFSVLFHGIETETVKNMLGIMGAAVLILCILVYAGYEALQGRLDEEMLIFAMIICAGIIVGAGHLFGGKLGNGTTLFSKKYILSDVLDVLAIIICIALLIINPFQDYIYYIGISVATLLVGASFICMFLVHNKDTLRPLPQLQKRGGDENA